MIDEIYKPENKVTDTIALANRPTNLFNEASDDDKENKLDKVQKN
jgi:hypothetical protein